MRTSPLSPRLFNSACYSGCGCHYEDSAVKTHLGRYERRHWQAVLPGTKACAARQWERWLLMHFPCVGDMPKKASYMKALLDAVASGSDSAEINPNIKPK